MLITVSAIYISGFIATFFYLLHVGRTGLSRRALQLGAALAWPLYWFAIQGPRVTLSVTLKILSFLVLLIVLALLLPFSLMERKKILS